MGHVVASLAMDEYTKQLIEDARATYHDVVAGRDSRAANPRGLAPLEVEQEPRACALWLFRRARHGGSRRNAALARTRTIDVDAERTSELARVFPPPAHDPQRLDWLAGHVRLEVRRETGKE